jgi:hypothetical protein
VTPIGHECCRPTLSPYVLTHLRPIGLDYALCGRDSREWKAMPARDWQETVKSGRFCFVCNDVARRRAEEKGGGR